MARASPLPATGQPRGGPATAASNGWWTPKESADERFLEFQGRGDRGHPQLAVALAGPRVGDGRRVALLHRDRAIGRIAAAALGAGDGAPDRRAGSVDAARILHRLHRRMPAADIADASSDGGR